MPCDFFYVDILERDLLGSSKAQAPSYIVPYAEFFVEAGVADWLDPLCNACGDDVPARPQETQCVVEVFDEVLFVAKIPKGLRKHDVTKGRGLNLR